MKNSSDTKLDVDTKGYTIEGKKGTWQVIDYILMNERKWFLMEHEEYGPRAAYVVLSDDGAVIMNDNYNGLDAEAREKIQSFLKQQEEKEQETSHSNKRQHQSDRNSYHNRREKNQSWQTGRRSWTTENIFAVRRWQKKPTIT